ncbi:MAG: DUF1295 domain-containing protein [Deltaproteobacteria bacterium]|nr:DUF1295 domain-containing protein [Deltaproteobacteria bacterium]
MRSRSSSLLLVGLSYLAAAAAALGLGLALSGRHPLAVAAAADAAATAVVFAFSLLYDNTSNYDPYWSLAPLPIAVYFGLAPGAEPQPVRFWLVTGLIAAWGLRLTWNWIRAWPGLHCEDWRYADFRARSGRAYWLVSFAGLHGFPTLVVFGGLVPVWAAFEPGSRPLGWLDGLAGLVMLGAICIEAVADSQLHRFVSRPGRRPDEILDTGLWRYARHPNYFGEISFWWGLYLFALAADPASWWCVFGPAAITIMFVCVSIPMIERRMRARRPGWTAHARRSSALVPLPPRKA